MSTQKSKNKEEAKASAAVNWTDHAWDEYLWWQAEDPKIVAHINKLIEDCRRDPFRGIGKPEPLKGGLTGLWSRRITREHRFVYMFEDGALYVVMCRFHYK